MTDDDLLDDFDDDDEPDFTALYEPHVDGDGWQMSPRMAWHLWSAARYLADQVRTSHPDPRPPPAPGRRALRMRSRMAAAVRRELPAPRHRLGAPGGDEVLARCTAEEIALHLTINCAHDHWLNDIVSPGTHPNGGGTDDGVGAGRRSVGGADDVSGGGKRPGSTCLVVRAVSQLIHRVDC